MPAPRTPPRAARRRALAVLLAGALALAACDEPVPERAAPTTTTTEAGTRCPDGHRPTESPLVVHRAPEGPAVLDGAGVPPSDGALDLGVLLPRTGDLAFLAPAPAAAVSLAVADIAAAGGVLGAPVTVHPADAAPHEDGAAARAVEALAAVGVDAIVGPITSGATGQVLERAAGSLLVSPGATSTALDALDRADRLFRTAPTDALQGRALAALVLDDGARSASLAVRADGYGRAIADAFAARFTAGGGTVASRVEHDPTDPGLGAPTVAGLDLSADAVVVAGLAESALVLDALADAGHVASSRPVYGTDGNLGERLAALVTDPATVSCLTGLLPVATAPDTFADRLLAHAPELGVRALDGAAEAYDAVALLAIAAASAGSDDPSALAGGLRAASRGGTACDDLAGCLARAARGEDVAYVGASGPLPLDAAGNRSVAAVTEVTLDDDGRLRRTGTRTVEAG